MKKILCFLLSLILAFSLVACSRDDDDDSGNTNSGSEVPEINEELTIGPNGEIIFPPLPLE